MTLQKYGESSEQVCRKIAQGVRKMDVFLWLEKKLAICQKTLSFVIFYM